MGFGMVGERWGSGGGIVRVCRREGVGVGNALMWQLRGFLDSPRNWLPGEWDAGDSLLIWPRS